MVFSSLIFVYAFLPVQFLIYYLSPKEYKNAVLLFFSLIFYSWSGPLYLFLLAGDSFVAYYFALLIQKEYDARVIRRTAKKKFLKEKYKSEKSQAKLYLTLAIAILLTVLVFFKYLSWLSDCLNAGLGLMNISKLPVIRITLPVGISFYTFQLISYVADVYNKKVEANKSYSRVLLYAGLFHQCIAGPIVRYETVANEIEDRNPNQNDVFIGIKRFSIGLAKKAVLANSIAKLADTFLPTSMDTLKGQTCLGLWFGAICYTIWIYLDFSAYSDMAIGLGRICGFHYMENFNYPYIASSVQEFWRRWHMSLSSFFRDYVYIPLGGSRKGIVRTCINLTIVFVLSGFWHGASFNFLFWGLYNALFIVVERLVSYKYKFYIPETLRVLYVFIVWNIGMILFRLESLSDIKLLYEGFINGPSFNMWSREVLSAIYNPYFIIIFFISILYITPLFKNIQNYLYRLKYGFIAVDVVVIFLFVYAVIEMLTTGYNPFIYFRF
ncbi:MAG TPA: membrane-bound O-acyltransferase family protein [Lachnospiraceae bacterium]|nr:membrane-bound O-acyltransferase family protein [Lachnospiraceae bacterium]